MPAGPNCPRIDEKFEPGKVPAGVCTLHSDPARAPKSSEAGLLRRGQGGPHRENSSWAVFEKGAKVPGAEPAASDIQIIQPTPGLQIAVDPRIPSDLQAFAFKISKKIKPARVEWVLNGRPVGETGEDEHRFLWPLSRGEYTLLARVWRGAPNDPVETPGVAFVVK
jgi:penicillin-binding protein 1C